MAMLLFFLFLGNIFIRRLVSLMNVKFPKRSNLHKQ